MKMKKLIRIVDIAFLILFIVTTLVQAFMYHNYSDTISDLLIIALLMRIISPEKDIEDKDNDKR